MACRRAAHATYRSAASGAGTALDRHLPPVRGRGCGGAGRPRSPPASVPTPPCIPFGESNALARQEANTCSDRLDWVKPCVECDRRFEPSSRHLHCPSCRRQLSHDRCACGGLKQPTSSTCQSTAGNESGNWTGGKTYHKSGYVMRRTPGHPRARGKSPYVFEHVLVMKEVLGRHLVEEESVHHLNGVKDDNRPENLGLWVRPQPSGIRASDAVAWAREILARYEGASGSSNNAQAED